jgi:hypothetical protein
MREAFAGCCLLGSLACQGDSWIIASELPIPEDPADTPLEPPDLVSLTGGCPSAADVLAERERAFGTPSVGAAHVGRWRGTLGDPGASGFPGLEVELLLDASGAGTFLFDAPAPSNEPSTEQGYLCSAASSGVVCGTRSGFVAGFAYALAAARSRDRVLSFVLPAADPWGAWCGLQASIESPDPGQACGFSFGVRLPAEPSWSASGCTLTGRERVEEIDCALLYALERCECARDACFAAFDGGVEVGLALTEDGAALRGSLWYENGVDRALLMLARVP